MNTENIEVAVILPRTLWEQLQGYAQVEQAEETSLLIQAIEQFLRQAGTGVEIARHRNGTHPKGSLPRANGRSSAIGKYAHLAGSTEAFMNAKQIDIQNEDRKHAQLY